MTILLRTSRENIVPVPQIRINMNKYVFIKNREINSRIRNPFNIPALPFDSSCFIQRFPQLRSDLDPFWTKRVV